MFRFISLSAVWEGQRRRSCTPRRTSPNLPFSSPTTQSQKSRNTRTTPPKKNQFQTITSNDNQFQPITNNDKRYLMCVAAASVAEATTYPLDLCKTRGAFYNVKLFTNPKKTVFLRRPSLATLLVNHYIFHRLQIQGELSCDKGSGKAYRGMLRTMFGIVREEVTATFLPFKSY